jgi:hypothetical protein
VADIHTVCLAPRMKSGGGVRTCNLRKHCYSILA